MTGVFYVQLRQSHEGGTDTKIRVWKVDSGEENLLPLLPELKPMALTAVADGLFGLCGLKCLDQLFISTPPPFSNKPYGFCGRKAPWKKADYVSHTAVSHRTHHCVTVPITVCLTLQITVSQNPLIISLSPSTVFCGTRYGVLQTPLLCVIKPLFYRTHHSDNYCCS